MNNEANAARDWPPLVRAFRHRDFRLFFFGQVVSQIGTWVQTVAQAWLIYKLTGSPAMLGLAGFAGQIPGFLISPLAGVAADRFNRRHIILCMQGSALLLALALAILTFTNTIQIWHVFVLGALLGITAAIEAPARQSMVAGLVDRPDLPNAIALNSTAYNTSRVIGPGIAGVLVALIGEGWCFLLNALTFVPVMYSLYCIRITQAAQPSQSVTALSSIIEGFRHFVTSPGLRLTAISLIGFSIAGNAYSTLMPIFADQVLHGGAHTLGWLMASAGVGAMLGAIKLAARDGHSGISRWIEYANIGVGLCLIAFAWSPWQGLSMALLAVVGYCAVLVTTSSNMLFQALVPDALRGRAMSIYVMILMGGTPLGALVSGALAEIIGVSATIALGGALCIAVGIWYGRRMQVLRVPAVTQ